MLLEVQWENCYTTSIIQLCCFLAGIYVCVHLFGCQNKSTCFQKLVFKCFLCACAANDAGREATGGPQQELAAKRLVVNIPKVSQNYTTPLSEQHHPESSDT